MYRVSALEKTLFKSDQYLQENLAVDAARGGMVGFYGYAIFVTDGEQGDEIADGNLVTQPGVGAVDLFQAHFKHHAG